jgi:hypothetical protein
LIVDPVTSNVAFCIVASTVPLVTSIEPDATVTLGVLPMSTVPEETVTAPVMVASTVPEAMAMSAAESAPSAIGGVSYERSHTTVRALVPTAVPSLVGRIVTPVPPGTRESVWTQ